MTVATLKAAATSTAVATRVEKPQTVVAMLTDASFQQQMRLALPRHMTPDRLARIALTEVRRVPKLAKCDTASFAGAVMTCAQLGLEPGAGLGQAYLLPFENRKANRIECQLIIGYRGMIDLARRSGQIVSIEARVVYEKDRFHVAFGLSPTLEHEPNWEADDRGPLRFVYAVAKLKDGGTQYEVMSRAEVEKIRARSKTSGSGPWVTDYDEMAKKTVIRRLFKYLPVSVEMVRATVIDEMADANLSQVDAFSNPELLSAPASANDDGDVVDADLPTHTVILDRISKSETTEVLDMVGDDIGLVADEQQRAELTTAWKKRSAELAK